MKNADGSPVFTADDIHKVWVCTECGGIEPKNTGTWAHVCKRKPPPQTTEAMKDVVARATKVPLHLLPAAGALHGAMACWNGAIKKGYGAYNWREKPISFMEMLGALERHIAALKDHEDIAQDSRVTHLGHIVATASILLDAKECGTLIDDRPARVGGAPDMLARLPASVRDNKGE